MTYRSGQQLRVTDSDDVVVIWDAAPGPGCYWAHVRATGELVRIRVRDVANAERPVVRILEPA